MVCKVSGNNHQEYRLVVGHLLTKDHANLAYLKIIRGGHNITTKSVTLYTISYQVSKLQTQTRKKRNDQSLENLAKFQDTNVQMSMQKRHKMASHAQDSRALHS
jgi:hypothetical protein